jgi:hypothetical protein
VPTGSILVGVFGVWCPEKQSWLETVFGQTQEFRSIPEANEQAIELRKIAAREGSGETYQVRQIGVHGHPVE